METWFLRSGRERECGTARLVRIQGWRAWKSSNGRNKSEWIVEGQEEGDTAPRRRIAIHSLRKPQKVRPYSAISAVPRFTRELSRSLFARTRVYSYAAIEATRDSLWPYRGVRLRRSVAKSEVNHDGEVAPRSVDMEIFDVISPTDWRWSLILRLVTNRVEGRGWLDELRARNSAKFVRVACGTGIFLSGGCLCNFTFLWR